MKDKIVAEYGRRVDSLISIIRAELRASVSSMGRPSRPHLLTILVKWREYLATLVEDATVLIALDRAIQSLSIDRVHVPGRGMAGFAVSIAPDIDEIECSLKVLLVAMHHAVESYPPQRRSHAAQKLINGMRPYVECEVNKMTKVQHALHAYLYAENYMDDFVSSTYPKIYVWAKR